MDTVDSSLIVVVTLGIETEYSDAAVADVEALIAALDADCSADEAVPCRCRTYYLPH